MAVPDTTTFELQDVVTEINPTTDDLVDCFADAVSADFDSNYGPGDESNLLQFRNYGAGSSLTSYSSSGLASSAKACGQPTSNTYYHNGSGTTPAVLDICYTDSAGTTALGSGWYKMADGSAGGSRYFTNSSGRVGQIIAC